MKLERWKKQSEEKLFKNPWWSAWLWRFIFQGQQIEYYFMKTMDSVTVVGVDDQGRIPMVRQYRALFDTFTLELPMGGVEKGQSIKQAAKHELAQEAQVKAGTCEHIGIFHSNNGRIQATDHVFIAKNLQPTVEEVDNTEEFERLRLYPQEIDKAIVLGEITCGMSIAAWYLARPYVQKD